MRREGSALHGLGVVFLKEVSDLIPSAGPLANALGPSKLTNASEFSRRCVMSDLCHLTSPAN